MFCFFACFFIYGRFLNISPTYVPYFAAAAGWLLIVIQRHSIIKEELLKTRRKVKKLQK